MSRPITSSTIRSSRTAAKGVGSRSFRSRRRASHPLSSPQNERNSSRLRRGHPLAPHAKADEPPRDPAEQRKAVEQPHQQRRLADRRAGLEQPADDPVLREFLRALDYAGRE